MPVSLDVPMGQTETSLDSAYRRLVLADELRRAERHALLAPLASAFAHLMGTPLHVVAGRAALIRSSSGAEAEIENARRIEEQVERLSARIRSFIDHLTLQGGKLGLRSVSSIVDDVLALYTPVAAARNVALALASADLPDATLEATSTLVVLTNLVSLATLAAPSGSCIELRVTQEAPSRVCFELGVPGFEPPLSRIDRLEPPEHADDPAALELLQVLAACHAVGTRQGARLELRTSTIRFECPAR